MFSALARLAAWTRVRHWAHFLFLPGASADLAARWESLHALLRGVLLAALVLAYGYLLNGLADRNTDRNAEKNPLVLDPAQKAPWDLVGALAASALAVSFHGPFIVRVATLVCLFSGTIYSVGPRLKAVPLVGTLLNITNFVPLLFFATRTRIPHELPNLSLTLAALLVQNQLLHEGADAEEDERSHVQSTYLWVGPTVFPWLVLCSGIAVVLATMKLTRGTFSLVHLLATFVFVFAIPGTAFHAKNDPLRFANARAIHRTCALLLGGFCFHYSHGL